MESLPIFGVIEGIFLIALILSKKKKNTSDYILSCTFFLLSAYLFLLFLELYNRNNNYPYPDLIHISVPIIFLHGPSIWFYIRSLTAQQFQFRRTDLFHLLPLVLYTLYIYFDIYRLPDEQKIQIDSSESFKKSLIYPITVISIAISTQGYYIWGLTLIRRYNKQVQDYFSKTEEIDLRWLRFFIIATMICFAAISTLYAIDASFGVVPYHVQELFVFIIASVYILVLGFYGHRQGNIFSSSPIAFNFEPIDQQPADKTLGDSDDAFLKQLTDFMSANKPYLDPEINIAKLSKELGITPEYLSKVINGKLNRNFFDFINQYRVDEFKAQCLLPENQKLTILSIAYSCGFNSKATFNRVFKKTTGATPSAYLKEVSD